MSIPTPHTVTRAAYIPGGTDAHGNPVDAWAAPVAVAIHGWSPGSADRAPDDAGRSALVRDIDLFAPAGTESNPRDRWTVDGTTYEAVAYADDYSSGPWGFAAGVRIKLVITEG